MKARIYLQKENRWEIVEISNIYNSVELKLRGIKIDDDAKIGIDIKIGDNTIIGNGVIISDYTFIGNNSKIDNYAILGKYAYICTGSTIGENAFIGNEAKIGSHAIIANGTHINNNAIIGRNVHLTYCPYIKGSQHSVNYWGRGKVAIGCEVHTFEEWLGGTREIQEMAESYEYYKALQTEYRDYVGVIQESIRNNPQWEIKHSNGLPT